MKRIVLIAGLLLPLAGCVDLPAQPSPRPPASKSPSARAVPIEPGAASPHAGSRPRVVISQPGIQDRAPDHGEIPANVADTPDAVPKKEPRSASGNPAEYEAFGEVYRVLDDPSGFVERGRASWYGKKFHGLKTASGEPYDMFAMTGAHKTLPIPSYVQVTNLSNGKTAVVRINDRGPFHSDRVIDLSYAAAARLDIIGDGHADVEIKALQAGDDAAAVAVAAPQGPPPAPRRAAAGAAASASGRWLQVAAYADPINAVAMRDQLSRHGLSGVAVRASGALHRVVVGPFTSDSAARSTRDWLHDAGYPVFWAKN